MTDQRPEDNEQALNDSGVWLDESSSGLTHEPGVWVDPPAIAPDRLGAMIREQDGVTEHLGDVQEPNVGGVPQPGSADQIHSPDLSSAYEEVSKNPIFDPTVTEQVGLTGAEEHALQEAGFASGGAQIDAVLAEIAAVLQLVSNTSASIDEQKAAIQEKIDGLKSGLSTDTGDQPALEDLTPQQWDVIGAIITTHLQPESEPAEAGPSPDLTSPAYEEVSRGDSVIDSVYGQTQETKSSKANEEALEGAKQQALLLEQQKSLRANEQSLEEMTNKKDGPDLSSAYEEAIPIHSVFDSVYGQIQGAAPPKADPTQYPPDLGSPGGGEEVPDGNANGIPGEYRDGPDLDGNAVPDEIGINPDSLQPGYPNSPWASSLDPALFDPAAPGPTLDPSLLDPNEPGPTIDPALFDPNAPGPTLDAALLDPNATGETIDPALLDPSAPGPTLDPAQLEQGTAGPSNVAEPNSVADPYLADPGLAEAPVTADQDFGEGY